MKRKLRWILATSILILATVGCSTNTTVLESTSEDVQAEIQYEIVAAEEILSDVEMETTSESIEYETQIQEESDTSYADDEFLYGEVTESPKQFNIDDIPSYSDKAYVEVNGNVPYFTEDELTTTAFENYSSLDALGRCGTASANICKEIMPTEERGKIGEVKPTGWHLIKYDIVDGNYLYNRCHLIGYQLSGENANEQNLITGTRYLNETGMLPFENMVANYVNETNNHVLYRVTPVFSGDNLLADGVLIEAESVEDKGEGILFNVFCYNVQPGIIIDYATGDSTEETVVQPEQSQFVVGQHQTSSIETYAVNAKNGKIHIVGKCPATKDGSNSMKEPVYFDTYEEAEAYSSSLESNQDKHKCGNCW